MKKIMLFILLLSLGLFAQENKPEVDCLILEDENSIICKYILVREGTDKSITFEWIDPQGNVSRTKDVMVLSNHGSVYDFRYINGREKGIWTFKVIDNNEIYKTQFEIK
ncbi:MAG: hypothetical protein HRT43_07945 [Campylobacteraceae bacterium]|nr:hypothetical protein [Campylobacteraceae bacterium]